MPSITFIPYYFHYDIFIIRVCNNAWYSASLLYFSLVLCMSVRPSHIFFFTHSFGKIQAHLQYRDNLFICMRFFSSLTFSIFWSISSKFLLCKFLPSSCLTYEHVQLLLRPWKLPLELLHHTRFISISIFTLCLNASTSSHFYFLKESRYSSSIFQRYF